MVTRRQLLASGISRRAVERDLRAHHLEQIHPGIYVAGLPIDGNEADIDWALRWRRRLSAHVVRGGAGSAVSHRAAAMLHRFDGWNDTPTEQSPEDVSVPRNSPFREPPAVRVDVPVDDIVLLNHTLPVTTRARTLVDLGRFVTADAVEICLESALRIDAARPDQWDDSLLAELHKRAARPTGGRSGLPVLRAVLARRPPGCRPTGSISETLAVQALRPLGLDGLSRQATIRFFDGRGALIREAFPDLSALIRAFLVEIDGAATHGTSAALDRDLRRQNILTDVFTVARWSARRVQSEPRAFAHELAGKLARSTACFDGPTGARWRVANSYVVRTDDGFDIHPAP